MRRPGRAVRRTEIVVEAVSANRTAAGEESGRTSPSDAWSYERTRIVPEAFDGLDTDTTLNILDTGPAEPQSIGFFRRYRCRLYVASLFNPAVPAHGVESAPAYFESMGRVRFDVCFLWDYINYPDDEAFAEFVSILADRVHERTRLYAIGAYAAELPLRAYRYAISDIDQVAIRPGGGMVPRPRSRNDLETVTRRFAVHRAALRRDNRLELLLRTVGAGWS